MRTIFLEGKKVFLSPLSRKQDLKEYEKWLNDQETVLFMQSGKFPLSVAGLRKYVDSYKYDRNGMLLGIFLKGKARHIGNIALNQIDWKDRRAEIGIVIGDKKSRGKGYATEAISLLAGHAFDKLNLHKLYAGMVQANLPSKRVFEKLGFKLEGVLKEHFYLNDKYLDYYRMGLLKQQYKRKNRR